MRSLARNVSLAALSGAGALRLAGGAFVALMGAGAPCDTSLSCGMGQVFLVLGLVGMVIGAVHIIAFRGVRARRIWGLVLGAFVGIVGFLLGAEIMTSEPLDMIIAGIAIAVAYGTVFVGMFASAPAPE